MKTKVAILSLAAICIAGSLMAQEVDDMYFNRKDRAKLNAAKASETTYSASKKSKGNDETVNSDESINPTDTYSARSTNPEYVSRANSEQAATDNQDYYVTDYRNSTANNLNKFNNNYNNWYNSTWYNNGYYGSSMYNGWNSPYYYNSFGNPWMSPYYQPGWGSSLSFYYGSPYYNNYNNSYGYGGYYDPFYNPYYGYGSGWGMGYGMGYGYPYYGSGFYSGWGMSYGYGLGSYYYWGGRPTVVVINNNSGEGYRGPVYGKRADRGGMTYNHQGSTSRTRQQTAATRSYSPYQGNTASNGRVATTSTNTNRTSGQADYYNRTWRSAARQQYSQQPSTNYNNSNSRSSWNNQSQSNWNNSNNAFQHNNNNTFTPSRSFDGGGGTRMHSSSPGGGSGGRTRGNH